MASKAVEARDLVKRYVTKKRKGLFGGEKIYIEALKGVSLSFDRGSVFGLLGPNGAGKTTTVKILATVLTPDAGEAYVDGYSVTKEPERVRENLGVVFSADRGFYWRLTGFENLVYYGMLYGMSRRDAAKKASELLELVDLGDSRHRLYEEYSLGMRARLAVAKALIHEPSIVILDEPTIGLDPVSSRKIREVLMGLARDGRSIMITTHNMWEAEIMCDKVAIIYSGRIAIEGKPEDLKARLRGRRYIEVEILDNPRGSFNSAEIIVSGENTYIVRVEAGDNIARSLEETLGQAREMGLRVVSVKVKEPGLEDVFIEVVGNPSKI